MRKICFIIPFLLLSFLSCTREMKENVSMTQSENELAEVRFSFIPTSSDTKSQYQESVLKTVHNVWVIGIDPDSGFWRTGYYAGSDLTQVGSAVRCPSMRFKAGSSIKFYVVANMGDISSSVISGSTANPENVQYILPETVNLTAAGMPMAAQPVTVTVPAGGVSVPIQLNPLLARVNVTIDKNGITDNTAAEVLASGELKVVNANRRLRPFGTSAATGTDDLFSVSIDKESFSSASSYDMTHSSVVLYVPENAIGDLLSSGSTQWDKGNAPASGKELCTYLEYTCSKNGSSDGISGNLSYRFYLGEDATHNFSVHRNAIYGCTLELTWNGLFYTGDWRIDNSGLSDGRLLTLSATPHTTSTTFTDMGRLRRNVAAPVYVNFSRDGGTTWVHSAKDIDGWPYGWDLYIDGVKQAAGASATAAGDLGWAYTSATAGDRIAITPGPSSVASSVHTLQVKSADGRVASNEVTFEVSQPLNFFWPYGSGPYYVAQRPVLVQNTGLEDSSATLTFTEKDGKTGIEFVSLSKTSMYLNLLAAGEYTIVATASNGQTGETTLTVKDPVVEQLWTSQALWVDGTDSDRMLRYKNTEGTEMTVANNDNQAYGTKFAPSLYETLLKPRIVSVSPIGTYAFKNTLKNLVEINNYRMYVGTLKCTVSGEQITVRDYQEQHFGVNVQAGIETLTYETYFKNPFSDVTLTNGHSIFHDFTTAYDHMTASQVSTYDAAKTWQLSSQPSARIYAQAGNVLVQTSYTIGATRDALLGIYSGGRDISLKLVAGSGATHFFHPSGLKDVFLHVQNSYDVAAGGERALYSLYKKIGDADIYMHVVWATVMKPQSFSNQYVVDVLNSARNYKKATETDVWDIRYLYGGFLNNPEARTNGEVQRMLVNMYETGDAVLSLAVADEYGFVLNGGSYVLSTWSPYGFIRRNILIESEDCSSGLGYAILKTHDGSGSGSTWNWSSWKASGVTSPFCRYKSGSTLTADPWSGNGLSGRHYRDDHSPKDGNLKGYLILHLLQDMPVNPNNGYIE